eukprot:6246362-Pyramimonas_sp.AAC.1
MCLGRSSPRSSCGLNWPWERHLPRQKRVRLHVRCGDLQSRGLAHGVELLQSHLREAIGSHLLGGRSRR